MNCLSCGSAKTSYDLPTDSYDCLNCGIRFDGNLPAFKVPAIVAKLALPTGLSYASLVQTFQQIEKPKPTPAPQLNNDPVLYCEPIIGWRSWHVEDQRLVSGNPDVVWIPGAPLRAEHQRRYFGWSSPCSDAPCEHHIPNDSPGCGIYALKEPAGIRDWFDLYTPCMAAGTVYLWGRIFEHEHGYRAQYAYPASIVASCANDVDLDELAAIYNVPTDKENILWKSVCRLAELYRSQSLRPRLYGGRMNLPHLAWYLPPSPPPFQSTSLPSSPSPSSSPIGSRMTRVWKMLTGVKE